MRVRVKICGITRLEDAEAAVGLGADAIGFIFWGKSPRAISLNDAARIASALPPFVTRVGVFVNSSLNETREAVDCVGLDAVQLHGDETPAAFRALPVRCLKVATLDSDADVRTVAAWPADLMPLVDATDRERRGGTGRVADWARAAQVSFVRPIVLSGGLTADNVAEAIGAVKPWAVDVSSGVEASPGVKSAERLRKFFAAVAAAPEGA
ncbi:MAG TPA: phosphoribosylanthranilate isomerase [Vicinamibacterales bacterium]|nr:phosphoribosylanthranilate isomerase [Vicinamibacterales bacterium]